MARLVSRPVVIVAGAGSFLFVAGASGFDLRAGIIAAGIALLFWAKWLATGERRQKEEAARAAAAMKAQERRQPARPAAPASCSIPASADTAPSQPKPAPAIPAN